MKSAMRIVAVVFAALVPLGVGAQGWPTKPVKLVVPFTGGSATDILARAFGQKLSELWGQPVVVENHPGAGGTIGTTIVAKAAPDGYTLLVHSAGYAVNPWIYPNAPYDTNKDFVEIAPLGGQPNVLVVAPELNIRSVQQLVSEAKAKPGAMNYASAGSGSGTHVNAEKFRLATGIDAVHVPYKGTPEALKDTLTGRVTYFFSPISAALPQIKEGKLVALGVSSVKRSSVLPDVPTIAESGLPGFDYNLWVAIFGPANMPADLVVRVNGDVQKVAAMPDIRERLSALGAEPMPMNSQDFRKFVRAELANSENVVKAAHIVAQ